MDQDPVVRQSTSWKPIFALVSFGIAISILDRMMNAMPRLKPKMISIDYNVCVDCADICEGQFFLTMIVGRRTKMVMKRKR